MNSSSSKRKAAKTITKKYVKRARNIGSFGSQYGPRLTAMPGRFIARGPEIKAIDITQTSYTYGLPATNTGILLNGVQAASGYFNRIGARIEMKNLHVRGNINNILTSIATFGRIVIVYDRQPTGAIPATTLVLQSRDQTGATTNTVGSEVNLDQRDRFVIIRDYQTYFPPVTNTTGVLTNGPSFPGEDNPFQVNLFIKLKGLSTHFQSTSNPTTIADIATGALYAYFVAGVAASWNANLSFRLRYNDL